MSAKEKRLINDLVLFLMEIVEASGQNGEPQEKFMGKMECFLNVYEKYKKLIYPTIKNEVEAFNKSLKDAGFDFSLDSINQHASK